LVGSEGTRETHQERFSPHPALWQLGAVSNAGHWTSSAARARFRESAEQLVVRLRWLSIGAIPMLAYLSDEPVRSPWFELVVASAVVYNWVVSRTLDRVRRGVELSAGTAALDCLYLFVLIRLSGGIHSVIITYDYLGMVAVCMRLPMAPSIGIGALYAAQLSTIAWMDGALWNGDLAVRICYVFLTIAFVSPLVHEARGRFTEVLAGHQAQRLLLHRLLRTGEDERRRIARELHDRGGGALFSLLHGLRRLREFVQPGDAVADAEVNRLIQVTEATVHDLRAMLADLRPRLLDDLGLAEALRELLTRERALTGIPVSFAVETDSLPDPESALALYRVAQEAFTNIRRHAHARAANVRLAHDDGGWSLAIEDDGDGLNGNRSGLGLRTMRERVEALGGRLEIHSSAGAGTRIAAWVPEHDPVGEGNGDSSLSR
jgi:signal transduction histidine kinase